MTCMLVLLSLLVWHVCVCAYVGDVCEPKTPLGIKHVCSCGTNWNEKDHQWSRGGLLKWLLVVLMLGVALRRRQHPHPRT